MKRHLAHSLRRIARVLIGWSNRLVPPAQIRTTPIVNERTPEFRVMRLDEDGNSVYQMFVKNRPVAREFRATAAGQIVGLDETDLADLVRAGVFPSKGVARRKLGISDPHRPPLGDAPDWLRRVTAASSGVRPEVPRG